MQEQPVNPLLAVLRQCSVPEQHRLAKLSGTGRNYLYQLAGCKRRPGLVLATKIVKAVDTLNRETNDRVQRITVEQIASMCGAN